MMRWLLILLAGCTPAVCELQYRDDGITAPGHNRYYKVQVCEKVLCDSPTMLPDPATKTGGCR
jgi:hypothetical protein